MALPNTLCETLGSRKLSGSSSSPSLSQARPFCCLPAFFWAPRGFPSSSDKSLSDSARISSILKKQRAEGFLFFKGRRWANAWWKAGFYVGNSGLPFTLCFRCFLLTFRVVLLLCGLFPPLVPSLSLADVCQHLVVLCREHTLHQLKTEHTAREKNKNKNNTTHN